MKHIPYIIGAVVISAIIFVSMQMSSQQVSHEAHDSSMPTMSHMMTGNTIVVHITNGDPNDPRQMLTARMGVMIANEMQNRGKDVIVYLDSYGTLLAPKQPKSEELKSLNNILQQITNGGGRVIVCPHCYQELGNRIEDLTPGFEISNPDKLAKILSGNVIVMDY